jgi:hypothetical protein
VTLELERMNGTLRLHTWVLSIHTAMLIAILWRVFTL